MEEYYSQLHQYRPIRIQLQRGEINKGEKEEEGKKRVVNAGTNELENEYLCTDQEKTRIGSIQSIKFEGLVATLLQYGQISLQIPIDKSEAFLSKWS